MKPEAVSLLEKILRDNALSVTAARRVVFDRLWGREPQTMHELETAVAGSIDRASLYRNINLFERLGLVQRVTVGWKYKLELSDVFTHHHHHISCLDCGKVLAIKEDATIERLIETFAVKYKITAERHQFEIQGYCENCQSVVKSV